MRERRQPRFHARLLARGVASSPDVRSDPWFGVMYPDRVRANGILAEAAKRGLWSAREEVLLPTSVRIAANPPPEAPFAGAVDRIAQEGARLRIVGWSHIPATLPGRTLVLVGAGEPARTGVALQDRVDVAANTRKPGLVFSGFVLEADYASAAEAGRAAASFCLLSHGSQQEPRRLPGSPGCPIR